MLTIQGTGRIKKMMGRLPSGEVVHIPNMHCARKHMINDGGWKKIRNAKELFAFVSSPQIYEQQGVRDLVKGWCHPFRDESKLPHRVPKILLPESDFLDKKMVFFEPKSIKYDYFYFTLNAKAGVKYKGLPVFADMLPTLCKYKLKGLVIVYFPNTPRHKKFTVSLMKKQRKNLKRYDEYLTYHWGILNPTQMNNFMTSCRFGLFPNTVDNSPRIISEALLRDIPIMVNKNIHGGWHYVNNKTGSLFNGGNKKSVSKAIEFIMNNKFSPREYFMSCHGFEKSSRKLATFINSLFGHEYTHAYFKDFEHYLRNIDD